MAKRKNIWEANKTLLTSLNDRRKADAALVEIEKLMIGGEDKKPALTLHQSMEGILLITDQIACGQVIDPKNVAPKIGEIVFNLGFTIFPDLPVEEDARTVYEAGLEELIAKKDATLKGSEKLKVFQQFAAALPDLVYNAGLGSFDGTYLKVSECSIEDVDVPREYIIDVEIKPSIIILAADPKEAVARMYKDSYSRLVFAEYDPKGSAETFVYKWYGTDGLFADHYWEFLNCEEYYPKQKRLIP